MVVTEVGVPVVQRLVVGAEVKDPPCDDPQEPEIGVGCGVGVGVGCGIGCGVGGGTGIGTGIGVGPGVGGGTIPVQ